MGDEVVDEPFRSGRRGQLGALDREVRSLLQQVERGQGVGRRQLTFDRGESRVHRGDGALAASSRLVVGQRVEVRPHDSVLDAAGSDRCSMLGGEAPPRNWFAPGY
jgi:hypothetical protein